MVPVAMSLKKRHLISTAFNACLKIASRQHRLPLGPPRSARLPYNDAPARSGLAPRGLLCLAGNGIADVKRMRPGLRHVQFNGRLEPSGAAGGAAAAGGRQGDAAL